MKRLFIYSVISAFALLASCSKDDDNPSIKKEEPKGSSYYVKYEARHPNSYVFLRTVKVNTETGLRTFNCSNSKTFSQTFGPVSKGFAASISVGESQAIVSIYVSRDQEPFALKTTGTQKATYKIDF